MKLLFVFYSARHTHYMVLGKRRVSRRSHCPGTKGAGGKQGKEVKTTAKQALLHLCLRDGILSARNFTRGLDSVPRGSERVMLIRWRKKS